MREEKEETYVLKRKLDSLTTQRRLAREVYDRAKEQYEKIDDEYRTVRREYLKVREDESGRTKEDRTRY